MTKETITYTDLNGVQRTEDFYFDLSKPEIVKMQASAKGGTKEAARAAEFFGYTKTYRRTLRKVRVLIALPRSWRAPLIGLYNSLAWRIARKGL